MHLIISVFLTLFITTSAVLAESKNSNLSSPENLTIDSQTLILNGAGIRKKLFIKVYQASLYLAEKTSSIDTIISMPGTKNVRMDILHSKIAAKKSRTAWLNGMEKNLSETDFNTNKSSLDLFNALFPDLHKGDQVDISFHPGTGTKLTVNGEFLGTVPGDNFFSALLMVWLGDKPADRHLKKDMMGNW